MEKFIWRYNKEESIAWILKVRVVRVFCIGRTPILLKLVSRKLMFVVIILSQELDPSDIISSVSLETKIER